MKKLIYCALALAAGLFAASCQQENLEPVAQEGTVTYTVEAPMDVQTKAIADGLNVDELIYEVWWTSADGTRDLTNAQRLYQAKTVMVPQEVDGKKVNKGTVTLNLVKDQHYTILFWAQVKGTDVYNTEHLTSVTYKNTSAKAYRANDDRLAAFYAVDFINDGIAKNSKVILKRPFAQVNLATLNERDPKNDTEEHPLDYSITLVNSKMTLKQVPTKFNVATSAVSEPKDFEFAYHVVPSTEVYTTDEGAEYYYAGMNYVFAGANLELTYDIQTRLNGSEQLATITNTIPNVPVKENYRTNIVGNLLTSSTDYEVIVDAAFNTNNKPGNIEVVGEGIVKNVDGDYEVTNERGLAYAINSLFAQGGNFYLTAELYDMTDYDVTPPSVPDGVVLNIYGETPVVTRAASDITAVTGVEIIGLGNLIDEVIGSASISGVKLSDDDAVLVNDATEGTLVVSNCEAETILPEDKGEVLEADKVENLAQLQAALVSGVKEINLTKSISIKNGEDVTISLKGKTVTGVDTGTVSFGLINNAGTLTISGPGTIQLSATQNRGWSAYSSVLSNQPGGNLLVKDGAVIEHLGGTDMAYGIDNLTNGKGTYAVTTVENATVQSTYTPIRQFLNGIEATNELYVNAGAKLISTTNYRSIFFQDPSANANTGKLVVDEGAELHADVRLSVTAGSTEWPVEVSIASSALKNDAQVTYSNVPELYSVIEENGVWTVKTNEAKVGDVTYLSFAEAVAEAKAGDTITMLSDVTLSESLTLPAGITFNGNGKQINGTIHAGGNLTFAGHTKVTAFSASYYNRTITIGEGACLEVTGGGRVSLAYGNTFKITGNIEDAKTADKANVQASLIIPAGISITGGNDATMNVTNAYVKIGSTTSKPKEANGKFSLNFDNSIVEFTKEFAFYEPNGGVEPTFEMNIKNSVFTTGAKLFLTYESLVTVDNSTVTLGSNIRNSGKLTLKNGSTLTGATIQFGDNGGNDGTINVDNSSLTVTSTSTGHAFDGKGVGSIKLMNGATATFDYLKDMILDVADGCTLNCDNQIDCRIPVVDGLTKHNKKNEYYVSSAAGLKAMNTMFENKTAGNGVVLNLTKDIDFTGKTWTPVDSHADTKFTIKEINGNGHTISNLTINGQAMFRRFAGTGDVVVKDITFDNATVNSNGSINTSIVVGHTYQNVLFDNVDVKNSTIIGGYKVAPLIATVYNENPSATITATLKDCDVTNTTVKATSYDFCTAGMVAFVYEDDNDHILFENCSVKNVKLYAPNVYTAHANVYTAGSETLYNEVEGVAVENVTFENI